MRKTTRIVIAERALLPLLAALDILHDARIEAAIQAVTTRENAKEEAYSTMAHAYNYIAKQAQDSADYLTKIMR